MSWEYSENILVQKSAGKVLQDKLGWEVVFAYNEEKLGEDGTLGRKSYKEIVLTRYLRKALFENNDWMTEEYVEEIYWKTADLTGQKIIFSKADSIISSATSGVAVAVRAITGASTSSRRRPISR